MRALFLLVLCLITASPEALERDYSYTGEPIREDQIPNERERHLKLYWYKSSDLCLDCLAKNHSELLWQRFFADHGSKMDLHVIPTQQKKKCRSCENYFSLYTGYLHFRYQNEYPFLLRQIQYTKKYPTLDVHWPETCPRAEKISTVAVTLFQNLFSRTALKEVKENKFLEKAFLTDSWWFYRLGFCLPRSLVVSCFRYSDFWKVVKDLCHYSEAHFSLEKFEEIEAQALGTLEILSFLFQEMVKESLEVYPTDEMEDEWNFLEYTSLKPSFIAYSEHLQIEKDQPHWFLEEFYFRRGLHYSHWQLYKEAIRSFDEALKMNPTHVDAYLERAHAYFELNDVEAALRDMEAIERIQSREASLFKPDFGRGLKEGIIEGSEKSVEMLTLTSYRGTTNGLWAYGDELLDTFKFYECMEAYIRSVQGKDVHRFSQELQTLIWGWEGFDDFEKGKSLGTLIGKYGIEIFSVSDSLYLQSKYQSLKRENTRWTLESLLATDETKHKVLEESHRRAERRKRCHETKRERILPLSPHLMVQWMPSASSWEHFFPLSGWCEADFHALLALLEKEEIDSETFIIEKRQLGKEGEGLLLASREGDRWEPCACHFCEVLRDG